VLAFANWNAKVIASTLAMKTKQMFHSGRFECKRIWESWWIALWLHQDFLTCHQWIN